MKKLSALMLGAAMVLSTAAFAAAEAGKQAGYGDPEDCQEGASQKEQEERETRRRRNHSHACSHEVTILPGLAGS